MPSQHSQRSRRCSAPLRGALIALVVLPLTGLGQTTVSAWSLGNSDAADTTAYTPTQTFQNTTYNVTGFTAGTAKQVASTADAAYVRRNTDSNANSTPNEAADNNNRSAIWEVQGTSTTNLLGLNTSTMTLSNVLLTNNVLMGVNDVFSNGANNTNNYESNIERLDFYWSAGINTSGDQGFAVFERGQAGVTGHDTFQIAVFTGWDTVNNKPTTYSGNAVEVAQAKYGSTNLDWDPTTAGAQTTFTNYRILRFNSGDNLTPLDVNSSGNTNQGVAGVFISFADLGIANGTKVYGYSLMATDATNTVANLADWTNTTYYPTTTADSTIGSLDLIGFNGRLFVPEPSTYGAILLGATVTLLGWRRYRRGVSAPAV